MTKENSDALKSMARERYYAQVAQGVQHFPKFKTDTVEPPQVAEARLHLTAEQRSEILSCCNCPLSQTRKKVILAPEVRPGTHFVLADFPEAIQESSDDPFHAEGALQVLWSLFDKLGLSSTVALSFALKCFPRKGIPNGALQSCSKHLRLELNTVRPQFIFVFGARALQGLLAALHREMPSEVPECGELVLRGVTAKIFVLPSAAELEKNPEWRAGVWKLLAKLQRGQ